MSCSPHVFKKNKYVLTFHSRFKTIRKFQVCEAMPLVRTNLKILELFFVKTSCEHFKNVKNFMNGNLLLQISRNKNMHVLIYIYLLIDDLKFEYEVN